VGDWVIDWLCEGKGGETREDANDDLRARPDFFNSKLWLDESARRVGPSASFCRTAGRDREGGWWFLEGPKFGRGVSLGEPPPCGVSASCRKKKRCQKCNGKASLSLSGQTKRKESGRE